MAQLFNHLSGDALQELQDDRIDWKYKGFPAAGISLEEAADQQWDVLAGDFIMPIMILRESALAHNLAEMSRYCRLSNVFLAPHGKTTMAPQLFSRQLDAGAWALTVATVSQARVARAAGLRRIIIANEVVEAAAVRWIGHELSNDAEFECYCLVDSIEGINLMTAALDDSLSRPIPVLLEIGVEGGRAGCRTLDSALKVAEAVHNSAMLRLAGIEAFEGVLQDDDAVERLLEQVEAVARKIATRGWFGDVDEVLVTAGGSVWFDRVADSFGKLVIDRPVRVVIRSGCYLTHDSGHYACASPFGGRIPGMALLPALEIWSAVVSRPEAELAILNFGRRDAPFDAGLPVVRFVARRGELSAATGLEITALNDQHAYLRLPPDADLAVGDLVGSGISHPCTAFDKWRLMPVVDDSYRVIDVIRTFF